MVPHFRLIHFVVTFCAMPNFLFVASSDMEAGRLRAGHFGDRFLARMQFWMLNF